MEAFMKYNINLNGKKYEVEVERGQAEIISVADAATVAAAAPAAEPVAPAAPAAASNVEGEKIVSPMPGTILNVSVAVSQTVKTGDLLIVLEAMKMENEIVAPKDGVIAQIAVAKGDSVQSNDLLVVIK